MNIYIANLHTALTDNDLNALFATYGQVNSATIAIDGFTDLSRGFGYVNMPDEQQALAAIAAIDKLEIQGLVVTVKEAENKEVRRGSYKVGNPAVRGYQFRKN